MANFLKSVLVIVCLAVSSPVFGWEIYDAWIDIEVDPSMFRAKAMCRGPVGEEVYYELSGEKRGPAGSSKIRQSGKHKLTGDGKAVVLSKLTMDVNDKDAYVLELKVFSRNNLMAEDIRRIYVE